MSDDKMTHFHMAGSGVALNARTAESDVLDSLLTSDVTLDQIIKPFILECPPDTPLHEAARLMSQQHVSSILVVDNGEAVGVWTERDALTVDFADPESFLRPVSEVMSTPVKTVQAKLQLQTLASLFREDKLRHYVVVDDNGRRCGIISQTDVVLNQGIEHYLKLRSIEAVVSKSVQILPATASLAQTATVMRSSAIDAVVIDYSNGELGILTERDVVRQVADQSGDVLAGSIASRPLLTVDHNVSLYRVRGMLVEHKVRHIGVTDKTGALLGLVSFTDILEGMELAYIQELQQALHERDEALNISQRNLYLAEKVIECSLEGIMITDLNSIIVSVNPAFTKLTGYTPADVLGKTPAVLSSGRHDQAFYDEMWQQLREQGSWQGEMWNRRKSGEIFPELLTITAITNYLGEVTHYAAMFNDISELKENEERIRQLAYYDVLTGLPNRRLLEDRLHMAMAHARRQHKQMAVLFIDLDRFKRINDSLGHEVGDQLLINVARRLADVVREDDTVARMGGDEFIAVLSDIDSPSHAAQIARRMIERLQESLDILGHELVVTSSIGISIYPDDGDDADLLLKNADIAMYRAKGIGRNTYQLYTPEMNARSVEHIALEKSLYQALKRDEFELYYQPQIDANSGQTTVVEALLRWHHPERGIVPPADFIPLAEETGLIVAISDWVLRRACQQLNEWEQQGLGYLRISVNISTRQFYEPDFCAMTAECLAHADINPQQLTLEMTENILMDDALAAMQRLHKLREMGFAIALDDFGTGFSSLNHLRRLPLDELKIDRAFIRHINKDPKDTALVIAMIGLAHSLGLQVVAEGVETEDQAKFLQQHGCDILQGFYYNTPVPADELAKYLP